MADKLLKQMTDKLGLDETQAKQALGALLRFCRSRSGTFDFDALLEKIPGMENVLAEQQQGASPNSQSNNGIVPPPSTSDGVDNRSSAAPAFSIVGILVFLFQALGLYTIIKNLVATYLGPNAVKMLEGGTDGAILMDNLQKLGVTKSQASRMAKMLVDFIHKKAGANVVNDLVKHVPALQAIMDDNDDGDDDSTKNKKEE